MALTSRRSRGRLPLVLLPLVLLPLVPAPALAQDYRFPAGDADYGYFYPTAYKDHGGADWNCGGITYSGHGGSDFGGGSWAGMDEGRDIVAAADGTVVTTNDGEYDRCSTGDCGGGGGYGNYVKIQHADGKYTYYGHLKEWSVSVTTGQAVTCGTKLGEMGSSGNSTGPHVHFEVREASGSSSDPFDGSCSAPPTYWISQGSYNGLPGGSCPNLGPCAAVGTLVCGGSVSTANNQSGNTQTHSVYGCGEWPTSGPEVAFTFSTPVEEPVTLSLTGHSSDLDLFLLTADTCDGSGAVGCSTAGDADPESITFTASAGHVYTVVVDGYDGAVSAFTLAASCTGGGGGTDTATTDDTGVDDDTDGPLDSRPWGDPAGSPDELPGLATPTESIGGCAALSRPGAGGLGALAVVLALALPRRRPSPRR